MLVIDTVGVKVGPFSMVDRYGTPHSDALHVVERYRLIDGAAAREAAVVNENLYRNLAGRIRGDYHPYNRGRIDPDVSRDGLQIEILVEDQRTFTMPWSGRVTYRPVIGDWPEAVCAERTEPFAGMEFLMPTASRQDF
jgi:hypothetical protein